MSLPASAMLLFKAAQDLGLSPQWETDSGLFSFDGPTGLQFVFCSKLGLNSQLGATLSHNKHFCHLALRRAGYPDIPFCRSDRPRELAAFFQANRPVIRKPVLGGGGRGVQLITEEGDLAVDTPWRYLLERYVEGQEFRYVVLKGRVVNVERHQADPLPEFPWHKATVNLPVEEWRDDLVAMALGVSAVLRLGFLAVDFLIEEDGTVWILETNSAPGLDYHPGAPVDMAALIMAEIVGS